MNNNKKKHQLSNQMAYSLGNIWYVIESNSVIMSVLQGSVWKHTSVYF